MRKLYLLVASCVALVAFMGFSVPAQAEDIIEPDCDGDPYSNEFALNGFEISTTKDIAGEISDLNVEGVACGTVMHQNWSDCGTPPIGYETLTDNARISVPPGVEFQPTGNENLPVGTVTGYGEVNWAVCWVGSGGESGIRSSVFVAMEVASLDECIADNESLVGGRIEGEVIACHRFDDVLRFNGPAYGYSVRGVDGTYTTVIGLSYPSIARGLAVTKIHDVTFCEYAGGTRIDPCGDANSDPEKWTQKNGDAGGCYEVTVINNSGDVSDPVSADPGWRIPNQRIQPLGCFSKKDVKSVTPWPPPRP